MTDPHQQLRESHVVALRTDRAQGAADRTAPR
ncbi:MAG: hypothetical protein JWN61_1360 [Pseudonocardiales bacterium]|nr:hypothetical protein [Pseudonocardiales bacterium]